MFEGVYGKMGRTFLVAIICGLCLAWGASAAPGAVHYTIDASSSTFTVAVFSGGLLSSLGHDHKIAIRDFSGDVQVETQTQLSSLALTIKGDYLHESVEHFTDGQRTEIDKTMREQVLETNVYPTITYRSRGVTIEKGDGVTSQVLIVGDLTLHGVTRPLQIRAVVTRQDPDLRAQGEFSIKHSDFGLKRISAAGGTIMNRDKMTLSFNIVAHSR